MIKGDFNSLNDIAFKVDIDISVFGLRNLIKNARRPTIVLRLTNDPKRELRITEADLKTQNPNFGKVLVFDKVELNAEPLLWPHLQIEVLDDGIIMGLGGCEYSYTTIPLIEFAGSFINESDILFAKA